MDQRVFSSFTEYKKYRQQKKQRRESTKEHSDTTEKHSTTLNNIYPAKRQNSEPIILKVFEKMSITTKEKEKTRATDILECEGYKPEKAVSLNCIIELLNAEWDQEPDFNLL